MNMHLSFVIYKCLVRMCKTGWLCKTTQRKINIVCILQSSISSSYTHATNSFASEIIRNNEKPNLVIMKIT